MTDLNTGITIDAEYESTEQLAERVPATTFRTFLLFVPGETVRPIQRAPAPSGSTTSMLPAYLECVATGPSDTILASATMDRERREQTRSARNAAVIALLEEWLADETGYDEATWPTLKEGIEQSRTSTRKRFNDETNRP